MNWHVIARFVGGIVTGLCCSIAPSVAQQINGLRGQQFCEVIISKGRLFEIYSTIHSNNCPQAQWNKLDENLIKKEFNSSFVVLNGPRQLMMDGAKNQLFIDEDARKFQGLAMRKSGVLHLSIRETLYGAQPYHEHHVNQHTIWVFASGKKIYEIIDPDGNVYVMHSLNLSSSIHSEKDLVNLKQRLTLPKGWQFKSGVLTKANELRPIEQKAIVIQDNLKNTYQLAQRDFL